MDLLADPQVWLSFLTLVVLEIVLGIDNIIFLSVLVERLPKIQRGSARILGLGFAMFTRIALLFSITWLATLRNPLFRAFGTDVSGRDLILFAGGLFLIVKTLMEFRDMKENLVSEEELRRAKDHLKGAMLLSLESSGARMSNLARHHIYFNRFYSMDDLIAGLEAVTREDLRAIARELFRSGGIAASVVGNLNGFTLTAEDLSC